MTVSLPAFIGILSWVTLVEMMVAAGIRVSVDRLLLVLKERGLIVMIASVLLPHPRSVC
ncbi:MAG: hypothetical protein U0744_09230 [Gemmataceae bacterium]